MDLFRFFDKYSKEVGIQIFKGISHIVRNISVGMNYTDLL